ncbi:serine/threonine-protein kinase [Actinoplanes sp. NBRC 101535]|uniref:serine/threonine-protein kinase n=1 Tax=Actinoplanes sp. NBRC 101535 TaxID=3032196 RepID=UPI0024A086DB|nr:serine/threonine-protein kinase [Actinoplanes sp. NBRC 101535]GLY06241.1 hypothetical protein Acsp01_66200 [Actinoplanes sp. NBRC 101535]
MPFPGETLGGRYRLDDRIAAGGMGEVWQATDTVLGRSVAVKTLLTDYVGNEGFRNRFEHEARVMAALRHRGVAPVYDYGRTDDGAWLVMAHVDGEPLNHRLAERGRLSPMETMSVVSQAAEALAAAHEAGIVHRDVKPGNLIIEPSGTVVLVDFGVARSAQSVTLTGAREVVGTALYIAPEQVAKSSIGPAADLYALGAVAYHCLAGHPPFEGNNPLMVALAHIEEEPPPLPADVPDSVRSLVSTALAKNPDDRFASASAMAAEAETAASSGTATVIPVSPGRPGPLTATLVGPAPAVGAARVPDPSGPAATIAPTSPFPAADAASSPSAAVPSAPAPSTSPSLSPFPSPSPVRNRRRLAVVGLVLLTLIGLGAVVALADPLGFFTDKPAPTTPSAPAAVPSKAAPSPTEEETEESGTETGQEQTTRPTANDEDTSEQTAATTRPTTRPAETTEPTSAPETTTPEEEEPTETTPADPEPTTTTAAPEPTGTSDETAP